MVNREKRFHLILYYVFNNWKNILSEIKNPLNRIKRLDTTEDKTNEPEDTARETNQIVGLRDVAQCGIVLAWHA